MNSEEEYYAGVFKSKSLNLARKEMRIKSDGCTELTCIYHGEENQAILDRHRNV